MIEDFQLWSDSNLEAMKELKSGLGFRDWDELSVAEKQKMWAYLSKHFNVDIINTAISVLNDRFKEKSYAKNFLGNSTVENAIKDFRDIIVYGNHNKHVVFELLSLYCKILLLKDKEVFLKFTKIINDILEQFRVNIIASNAGFIPRQEKKITEEIYKPVLNFLINKQWEPVNRDLKDAFRDFDKHTPEGFSSCITHCITSIEAFLQISIDGKIGKGTLTPLILDAQKKKLIPDDDFTKQIFKNIESILMKTRKQTGNAHPKKEYADQKQALLILNLTMVFLQHCISSQK